jgi:hypothetical protein
MDPAERIQLLDAEGIDAVVLYTTIGLLWQAELDDGELSQAYTRAYNRWICSGSARLVPTAHLSLSDPAASARGAKMFYEETIDYTLGELDRLYAESNPSRHDEERLRRTLLGVSQYPAGTAGNRVTDAGRGHPITATPPRLARCYKTICARKSPFFVSLDVPSCRPPSRAMTTT